MCWILKVSSDNWLFDSQSNLSLGNCLHRDIKTDSILYFTPSWVVVWMFFFKDNWISLQAIYWCFTPPKFKVKSVKFGIKLLKLHRGIKLENTHKRQLNLLKIFNCILYLQDFVYFNFKISLKNCCNIFLGHSVYVCFDWLKKYKILHWHWLLKLLLLSTSPTFS